MRARGRAGRAARESRYLAVLVLLVGLFVLFSLTQDAFFTSGNINNLLTSVSILFVVSIGLTFVMLAGGFDLSLGSIVALTGILLGKLVADSEMPAPLAAALTLAGGAALGGMVNGFFIGRLGLSFLVITLGSSVLFRGVLNLWSEARTTPVTSPFLDGLAFNTFLGLPIPVWIMLGVFLVAFYALRRTYFGRDVYAVGGNADAARLSGVNVSRTVVAVYAIAGLLSALGGIIQVSRVGAASPLVGDTIIFDAAAAVLLGGTSFAGGVGGVTGTMIGVLFLGVLQNGLAVSGVQSFWQQVITGAILIAIITLDRVQREGLQSLGLVGRRLRPTPQGAAAAMSGSPTLASPPAGTRSRGVPAGERTIPRVLERQAERHGERLLVSAPGGDRTYAQLRAAVAARAGALLDAGLQPGDRVALMSANRVELLETMLACAWAGVVAVPVNTALRGAGLRHVLTDCDPALLVVEPAGVAAVEAAIGALPPRTWVLDSPSFPPDRAPAAPVAAQPTDVATILYTSGTTGPAKGVVGPHGQVVIFAMGVGTLLELDEDDVLFTCLPLFHVNAWSAFFQALLAGARIVIRPRFSASTFIADAIAAGATVTYLLGAMIPMLLRRTPPALDRRHALRIVNGMTPPEPVARELHDRLGLEVLECYASTETGCVLGAPRAERRPGWMGRAMPGWEVRVVDGEDLAVSAGVPGELLVRAAEPNAVAAGYWNRPDATVRAWRNLWFHTGDRSSATRTAGSASSTG
jgi:ribose/xylose/arabinose/galactoside ABC-type transport system permease subunit/non-ribosomal peptide synthetase component E (peptide arylation enzyme)